MKTLPSEGPVGAPVQILGTDLTGATGVSFNGKAATFTVASASLITANVPTGATSGFVTVTTPGGTLTSNVPFVIATTTTVLSSFSPNPSAFGEAVTVTAASFTTSSLAAGVHTITATHGGSTSFYTSSVSLTQTVNTAN